MVPGAQPAGHMTDPINPLPVGGKFTVPGPQGIGSAVTGHDPHDGSDLACID